MLSILRAAPRWDPSEPGPGHVSGLRSPWAHSLRADVAMESDEWRGKKMYPFFSLSHFPSDVPLRSIIFCLEPLERLLLVPYPQILCVHFRNSQVFYSPSATTDTIPALGFFSHWSCPHCGGSSPRLLSYRSLTVPQGPASLLGVTL